jgi:hypothetical protein
MRNCSVQVGREDIFKLTIGNESLHEVNYDNGVRVINFATSKNLTEVQCSHVLVVINLLHSYTVQFTKTIRHPQIFT